jgi:hypothetical protein
MEERFLTLFSVAASQPIEVIFKFLRQLNALARGSGLAARWRLGRRGVRELQDASERRRIGELLRRKPQQPGKDKLKLCLINFTTSSCLQSSIQISIDNPNTKKCLTFRETTLALSCMANAAMSTSLSPGIVFCLIVMTHKRIASSQICFVAS